MEKKVNKMCHTFRRVRDSHGVAVVSDEHHHDRGGLERGPEPIGAPPEGQERLRVHPDRRSHHLWQQWWSFGESGLAY